MSYLDGNRQYWERGYSAPNVDHNVFRFYGRILKHDFPGLLAKENKRLVDFGCGEGSAVNYFVSRGFNAVGCDISRKDIGTARARFPDIAERFQMIAPDPRHVEYYGFASGVDVVTAFQSLYYFNRTDLALALDKLHASMNEGGVFFATMMGACSDEFFGNSEPAEDGLRVVNFSSARLDVADYAMLFIEDEADLKETFRMFRPLHVGYYSARFREDEGDGFHYTFCGVKDHSW